MQEKTYPLPIAAKAAGLKYREFRRHIENGHIKLQGPDRVSSGTGMPTGYSRRRILQAAITKSLTLNGVKIVPAATAALSFSDKGQTGRAPGSVFPWGKSVLVVGVGPDGATVVNVFHDTTLTELSKHGACTVIVDLNRIVETVDAILNESNK